MNNNENKKNELKVVNTCNVQTECDSADFFASLYHTDCENVEQSTKCINEIYDTTDKFANVPIYKCEEKDGNVSVVPNVNCNTPFEITRNVVFSTFEKGRQLATPVDCADEITPIYDFHQFVFNAQPVKPGMTLNDFDTNTVICARITNQSLFQARVRFLIQEYAITVSNRYHKIASERLLLDILHSFYDELEFDNFNAIDNWIDTFRPNIPNKISPFVDVTALYTIINNMSLVIAANMHNAIIRHNMKDSAPYYSYTDIYSFTKEAIHHIYDLICCILNEFLYVYKPASLPYFVPLDDAPNSKYPNRFVIPGDVISGSDQRCVYHFDNSTGEVSIALSEDVSTCEDI